jgi:hypothetical protein
LRQLWHALRTLVLVYGFALLVSLAATGAAYLAIKVSAPDPVPSFALRAESIYRIEVGGAAFVAFYLVALFLVLALNGEGPRQLGTNGFEAGRIVRQTRKQQQAIRVQDQSVRAVRTGIRELQTGLRAVTTALRKQEVVQERHQETLESTQLEVKAMTKTITAQHYRIKTLELESANSRHREIKNSGDDGQEAP